MSCNQNKETKSYTIIGKISGMSTGYAFLEYANFKDTTEIKNGEFIFKGTVQKPEICKIRISGSEHAKKFYIENSNISFIAHIDSLDKAKISGSKTENEWIAYKALLSEYDQKYKSIRNEYESADKDRQAELIKIKDQTEWEQAEAQKNFVKNNPSSYLCIAILWDIDWSFRSASEYNKYINLLDSSLSNYKRLIDLKELVGRMDKVELGQTAPDFKIKNTNGELIHLSDLYSNSNYLLLDFWASHCGSCRKENTYIKKAYNKFHKKGFDVVSVSTDTDRERWLNAVKKDELTWTNACNLKKWKNNEIVKKYALRQISNNLLLDRNGKIIAKDLRGNELLEKIDELVSKLN